MTGPVNLLLVADTHVTTDPDRIPGQVWLAVEQADVVVHAGDWIDPSLLDLFEARARRVIGVHGNNDGAELRARLPEVARAVIAGVRLAVVHETGPTRGREHRCQAAHPDTDLLVFGHSHIPWDSTTPSGLRLLNPGSPTDRRRQPWCSYLTATAEDGRLSDVTLHQLPGRPGSKP